MYFLDNLKKDISNEFIKSGMLLDNLNIPNPDSRASLEYKDNRHAPFYFHLGKYLTPTNLLEIGFDLGLLSTCFLKQCKSVKNFLAFQEMQENYPDIFGRKNIKTVYKEKFDLYVGGYLDAQFNSILGEKKWDLCLFNNLGDKYDKERQRLDLIWQYIAEDGYIVINHVKSSVGNQIFTDFCKTKSRDVVIVPTRYGTGIVKK